MEDVAPADKLWMTVPKQTGHPVDVHSLGPMASQDNKHEAEKGRKVEKKAKTNKKKISK